MRPETLALISRMTAARWAELPLNLRQRWWNETDFGKTSPSVELEQLIQTTIDEMEKRQ